MQQQRRSGWTFVYAHIHTPTPRRRNAVWSARRISADTQHPQTLLYRSSACVCVCSVRGLTAAMRFTKRNGEKGGTRAAAMMHVVVADKTGVVSCVSCAPDEHSKANDFVQPCVSASCSRSCVTEFRERREETENHFASPHYARRRRKSINVCAQ